MWTQPRWRTLLLFVMIAVAIIAIIIGANDNPAEDSSRPTTDDSALWCVFFSAALVILVLTFVGYLYARVWWQNRPLRQIVAGHASEIRAIYAAKTAAGDTSAKTWAVLAYAHLHSGDFAAAEHIARESLDRLTTHYLALPPEKRQATRATELNNTALILTYALIQQNRLQEAAEVLQQQHHAHIIGRALLTAQLYYLAGDEDTARRTLGDLRITPDTPPPPRFTISKPGQEIDIARRASYPDRLVIAYLRHKLYGEDPLAIYRKYAGYAPMLIAPNPIFTNSQFAQHNQTIVDEIRAAVGEPAAPIRPPYDRFRQP